MSHRYPVRADFLFIVPLVPGLYLGYRFAYLGEQGLERLQKRVLGLGHRLARVRRHDVWQPLRGEVAQAPWCDQVHGGHARSSVGPRVVRKRQHGDELFPVVLMVLDVVLEHVHNRLAEARDLAIGLRVVRGRVQVPYAIDLHTPWKNGEAN